MLLTPKGVPMTKPIIGIPLDFETAQTYANYPWYALRENYTTAILNAGGIPVLLPHFLDAMDDYVSILQGLLIPGDVMTLTPPFMGFWIFMPVFKQNPNERLLNWP
jgi:putative glutamine amidotransferase